MTDKLDITDEMCVAGARALRDSISDPNQAARAKLVFEAMTRMQSAETFTRADIEEAISFGRDNYPTPVSDAKLVDAFLAQRGKK